MNIDKDYYAILGVLPSAEEIVIKAAYRALSKRYHPDVYTGPNIAEKMADINEADVGAVVAPAQMVVEAV